MREQKLRDWIERQWIEGGADSGAASRIDIIPEEDGGNVLDRFLGLEPDDPAVLAGSHPAPVPAQTQPLSEEEADELNPLLDDPSEPPYVFDENEY